MKMTFRVALLVVFVVGLGGCLINSHSEKTVGEGTKRVAVAFENDVATRLFTQTFQKRYRSQKDLGVSHLTIPFIISSSQRRELAEDAFFNAEVERVDFDRNGIISESEARAYANEWEK